MKKKTGLTFLIFAALVIAGFTACGKNTQETKEQTQGTKAETQEETEQETSAALQSAKTLNTSLWDLTYDEQDGWVYSEEEFYDEEAFSNIILTIPREGEEGNLISAEIYASVEEPYYFRDSLTSYGFDEYEYAVNQSYDLTDMGGIGCLKQEGNDWGSPCLRYFNRVEGAGVTVSIEIVGEYEDERVDKLLSGLTFHLEDVGNEDGPWYWEGEPFSTDAHSVMVGTYTLDSQWIPITDCIMTKEIFEHAAAAVGNQVYLLVDGALKRYDFDGASLKFAEDIALDAEYENITADTTGTIWLANFMEPLISWKDGVQTASYEGMDYVTMHPSGTWGISWFTSQECEKVTISDGAIQKEPIVFKEVDLVSQLLIDENHIYICGSAADGSGHKVFVYDTQGNLQLTLGDSDGSGMGSVTFITETANGYLALDGNMREVVLWTKDGTYIGKVDDGDLFGTGYPWFCGATKLEDGSILAVMTEERADKSADELIAFRLSGF